MIIIAILMPLFLLTLYVVTTNSDDFETAQQFVTHDARVAAAIGDVRKVTFRFWSGFESVSGNGGQAFYSFDVLSNHGDFVVEVQLRNIYGSWHVMATNIDDSNGLRQEIKP
jgi:hypothetical protein